MTTTEWITLTPFAVAYLKKIIKENNAIGIIIALEKAGCAGYMYRVEPCHTSPDDAVQQVVAEGLTIYVPRPSIDRLKGSRLDYQRSQLEVKAIFENPNVRLACGCGDSVELINTQMEGVDG